MAFLFGGGRQSDVDSVRAFQRQVASSARGTEREIAKLTGTERQLLRELKRCGTEGNLELAKVKAQELIRMRAHRSRLYTVRANFAGLAQQIGQLGSSQRTMETVARTTRFLQSLNGRTDAAGVHRMLVEFQRQNDLMGDKRETLDETLDAAFEAEGEAGATEDAVAAVFLEAGVEASMRLGRAGVGACLPSPPVDTAELEDRLERLRRG